MSLTFGLTGMDPDTGAALKAAFEKANARLGGHWQLLPDDQADHVVVDMDTMYGPMSWLKLHAAGKTVIGLTSGERTQTDMRLPSPVTDDGVAVVLQAIAEQEGVDLSAPAAARATPADEAAAAEPATTATQDIPAAAAPASESAPAPEPAAKAAPAPEPASEPEAEPEPEPPPPPPLPTTFAEWLAPDALSGKRRFQRGDGPLLLLDIDAHTYHGPATLKPLAEYFDGKVEGEEFAEVDDNTWAGEAAKLGAAQPMTRLIWFGALTSGKGSLMPGMDPAGQYQLGKWPQTEREFPKHFRIATVMMKGPATVADISKASGVPEAGVADFVNANLATGFAEPYVEPPPEPVEQKSNLFSRLRGRLES